MAWAFINDKKALGATPVAVKFHGMNMFQKQPDLKGELVKFMLRPSVRRIMRKADYVLSYGGKITEIIQAELSDPEKVIEVPSGIERDWVKNEISPHKSAAKKFLFVGRYDRLKGLPELYTSVTKIPEKLSTQWTLTIVGPIPEKHRLEHANIKYTGPIQDQGALMKLYDEHDILVCPSVSEGMPNVIMEGMARGLMIIASDVGATNALVKNGVGMLIKPQSVRELADALLSAIDMSPQKLHASREAALRIISDEFLWEKIGNRLLEQIQSRV